MKRREAGHWDLDEAEEARANDFMEFEVDEDDDNT